MTPDYAAMLASMLAARSTPASGEPVYIVEVFTQRTGQSLSFRSIEGEAAAQEYASKLRDGYRDERRRVRVEVRPA